MYRSKTPGPNSARQRRHDTDPEPIRRSQTPHSYERHQYAKAESQQYVQDAGRTPYTRTRTQTLPGGAKPAAHFDTARAASVPHVYPQTRHQWEAQADDTEFDARVRMMREKARRMAAMREVERTRIIQEEVKRVQARIQQRRDYEWEHFWRKLREEEEERERQRQEAVKAAFTNAWNNYEKRWATLANAAQPLTFAAIPWPTLSRPSSPQSLNIRTIAAFLLSPHHSSNVSPKDRMKQALKRWHPDRFGRFLAKAKAEDKAAIEEGAGIVARCLNELLHGEAKHSVN